MSETLKKLENLENAQETDELVIVDPDYPASAMDSATTPSSPASVVALKIDTPIVLEGSPPLPATDVPRPEPGPSPSGIGVEGNSESLEAIIELDTSSAPQMHAPATGVLHLLQQQRRELLRKGQNLRNEILQSRVLGGSRTSPRLKMILVGTAGMLFVAVTTLLVKDLVKRYGSTPGASSSGTASNAASNGPIDGSGSEGKELTWEERYQIALNE